MPKLFFLTVQFLILAVTLTSWSVKAEDTLRLQLLWKHQFQFAGYYMAIHKGFYAEEGIKVELTELGDGIAPYNAVTTGEADFGVGRSALLINDAKASGLVALFAAFQQSPLMLLTTESSGIEKPSDLLNKRIMITNDAKKVGELLAMLLQSGITGDGFEQQQHSYNIQDLIDGNTDAMASYISNEPYVMTKAGVGFNIIHPKDFGFDMYSDILFTTRSFALKYPELTERFYRASIRGWHYAFNNIPQTAEVIYDYYNSQNKSLEALIFEGEALKPLAYDDQGNFGTLSLRRFNEMAQVYLITNSISRGYRFDEFIYKPASNRLRFTQNELDYLAHRDSLKLCINPDWYPYESYKSGLHQGMVADYIQQIMDDIGVKYRIVASSTWRETLKLARSGKCDLVAGAMQTIQRSNYLDFSSPYLSIPAVAATLPENRNIQLKDQRIAVKDQSAFHDILLDRFPTAEIVPVTDMTDGFHMVVNGEVEALIGAEASLIHKMRVNQITGLSISNLLHDSWDISIAVSKDNPVLLSTINKAIVAIPQEKHEQILKHWFKVDFNTVVDYSLLWKILAGIGVIVSIGLYHYFHVLRYNKKVTRLAERDELTGVLSRRKMHQELEASVKRSDRRQKPLSLIFFDVDNFKQINDNLGHGTGDQVLIDLTRLVMSNTRNSDLLGRWGGEEFILIMKDSDLGSTHAAAEKICQKVAEHDFSISRQVSCSFGIAQFDNEESIDRLIMRADEAMYQAKANGKNCVVDALPEAVES